MALIRLATLNDAEGVLSVYAPYIQQTAISFEYEVPTLDAYRERMRMIGEKYPFLVYEVEGKILGYAHARPQMDRAAYQWNAELSIYMAMGETHRGVGQLLFRALLELLTLQNVQNVYGGVTSPNPASEQLQLKLGFHQAAVWKQTGYKFEKWHDVIWFEKHLNVHQVPPQPFLPFVQLGSDLVKVVLLKYNAMLSRH